MAILEERRMFVKAEALTTRAARYIAEQRGLGAL